MKKFYVLCTLLCCLLIQQFSFAQNRYVDEVFTDDQIVTMTDINYAVNMSILAQLFVEGVDVAIPEQLVMDIYMPDPAVDNVTDRPIVLIPAQGLLPLYIQECFGDKGDLQHTSLATKLAKTGYVVGLVNMRDGWNPLVTTPNAFLTQLADAVIRQIQDFKAAARFLQIETAENGNPYGINPDKMISWAITNGASSVAIPATYALEEEEFSTPAYFTLNEETGELENVVDLSLFGNVDGTEPGFDAAGNITNLPSNNGCYEADFKMVIASGGVTVDTVLMQAGEAPLINFVAKDYVATSVEFGPLNLPSTGDFCCLVYFGHTFVRINDDLGNNDEWKGVDFGSDIANSREIYPPLGRPIEGLYYLSGDPVNSYPWIGWDTESCNAINPDLNAANLEAYAGSSIENMNQQHDEMIAYALPRACITLGLDCNLTGLREEIVEDARIAVAPNPSTGDFVFTTSAEHPMETISIYNVSGSLMYQSEVYNDQFSTINLDLANGMYIAKIKFEDGVASKKIMVGE